jgi:hypothetical protein
MLPVALKIALQFHSSSVRPQSISELLPFNYIKCARTASNFASGSNRLSYNLAKYLCQQGAYRINDRLSISSLFSGIVAGAGNSLCDDFNCLQNRRNTMEDGEKSEIGDHGRSGNELGPLCGL